ncbi:MAG TPA: DUF4271 domain-containing protein [Flavobacteriaceae bacterium]|nr:DUF4271 domain-containing protein [Flavobacteriaceae bacterium]MCB9214113.1 DUF4271 domain-containing protein [Alteromonas sp.]HPF11546.1 DUF4271 domain-containing protein [Flavobacteriaceae bacterium]HQU21079.1 DUF4271 domain-containing protein [Flavobacteriaceae bacterium]HQU65231.1 DUF4271 domain-containing protein [Flavobacteriaceae bacterium]
MQLEPRHIDAPYWPTLLFVGIFVLLACARVLYPKRFLEFIQLPLTDRYFALEGKSDEIRHPFNLLLFGVQVCSFSLFLYITLTAKNPEVRGANPWLFLQIATGFFVFVTFRYYLEKLIAHTMNIEPLVNRYLYEKLSYTNLISLFVYAASLLLFFSIPTTGAIIPILASCIALFYAIALFSSAKRNGTSILQNIFYFILYLCALEIAPYILLYMVWVKF